MFDNLGRLILRLTVGGLMLTHGIPKLFSGVEGIAEMLAAHNLPGFIAYGVYVGEVIAPLLIIVGYYTRPAAAVLAFNMIVAVGLAHRQDIFRLTDHYAWALELHAFYFFGAVAVALFGAGAWSLSGGAGKWD